MIPREFIQSLLGRVDIVDVVDRYVKLKKAGSNYQACCPFHNEKTPSFTVSPSKQFYHCFGCGAHGNAVGFLMEYSGLAYPEAIRALAETVGMEVPETRAPIDPAKATQAQNLAQRMMEALSYYRAELKKSRDAIDYLKGRGLSGEIAARYGLGYAPEGWQNLAAVFADYATADLRDTGLIIDSEPDESAGKKSRRYDRFRHRVMFPILDARGNVIGFGGRVIGAGEPKYLNSPETPLFEKGRELYGLYQARRAIRDRNEVIVVEGYMDVVALAQHGVENAVATLGTATTPNHVAKLVKLADNVVFCFDGDAAGRKAAWRALEVSLPELADGKVVSFLFLPEKDDPDDFVRREGREAFLKAVGQARPLSQFLFSELGSHVDMSTEEGRARFLAQARPLVEQVKAPALAAMLRRHLAQLSQLDAQEIDRLVPGRPAAPAPAAARRSPPARTTRKPIKSPDAQLLGRVLARPEIALQVPDEILDARTPIGAALAEAVAYFRSRPDATLGQASAHFEGSEHQAAILDALNEPLLNQAESPDFDLVAEGRDLIERMLAEKRARRSAELMPLVAGGTATPEQKAEYEALIQRLSVAKQGNAGPGERSKL